jgi:hypothetical protein
MILATLAAGFALLLIQQAREELAILDRDLDSVVRTATRFFHQQPKPYQKRK